MIVNQMLVDAGATSKELDAHYRTSYASMVVSLNNMPEGASNMRVVRPDLHCLGLFLRANGIRKPSWWEERRFISTLREERGCLGNGWEHNLARILGLEEFPNRNNFDFWA
jgi:hypothetical protein